MSRPLKDRQRKHARTGALATRAWPGAAKPVNASSRAGLTLIELMMATVIMALVAGALSGLAIAVRQGWEYGVGYGTAAQHGRVTLERISRAVREATATENYPGVAVAEVTIGPWRFPENLVVWHPDGEPANPDGPPLVSELIIFGPDPNDPTRLMEYRAPSDSTPLTTFDGSSASALLAAVEGIKAATTTTKTELTDLVRAPAGPGATQSAIRFERELRPAQADWNDFVAGAIEWDQLDWPQGVYGSDSGLRQVWVRTELQLMPSREMAELGSEAVRTVPFFGSAELYYPLDRD